MSSYSSSQAIACLSLISLIAALPVLESEGDPVVGVLEQAERLIEQAEQSERLANGGHEKSDIEQADIEQQESTGTVLHGQEKAAIANHGQGKAATAEHGTEATSQHAKAASVQREQTGTQQRHEEQASIEHAGWAHGSQHASVPAHVARRRNRTRVKEEKKGWVVPLAVGVGVLVLVVAAIWAAVVWRKQHSTDAWKEHVAELEKKGIYWDKKTECFVKRTKEVQLDTSADASILY